MGSIYADGVMIRKAATRILSLSLSVFFIGFVCSCGCRSGSRSGSGSHSQDKISYAGFRAEQKSFTTSDGAIKYMDKGPKSGEVIVLLHGVPTSGWLYRKMIDDLAASGYRVIAPDMLGFGSSDNPDGYALYNEKNHAARLLQLMDGLGVKRWHHVCHDAGGLWTQALAEKAAHRMKSVTVLNSVLLENGFTPPIRMKNGVIAKAVMATYRSKLTNGVMINGLFNEGLEDCRELTDEGKKGYRQPLLEGRAKSLYYFFTKTCNDLPSYKSSLRKLGQKGCPVQVIWGVKDEMLLWEPQAVEASQLLGIKASDVHLLQANHFLQEEEPEKVAALIRSFVSGWQVTGAVAK